MSEPSNDRLEEERQREEQREQERRERIAIALAVAAAWIWNDQSKRYRNTTTGRSITQHKAVTLRDFYTEAKKSGVDRLSRQLTSHKISLQQWVLDMRTQIKDAYNNQYMLGRGGRNVMTQSDWGRVGGLLKRQYDFLNRFAQDIDAGKLSEGQIRTRSRMYIESSTQAFERAKTESLGLPLLPQYPGDGRTVCRSNCQCHWNITDEGDHWNAVWQLGVAEHCPDCVENADKWDPLVVPK